MPRRSDPNQGFLFETAPIETPFAIAPATIDERVRAIGERLASLPGVHFGTSSWSFPGWRGIVYGGGERGFTESQLARDGLAAYARHPVLGAVGIDRTYYATIDEAAYAAYAASVPDGFRFLVKAHADLTRPKLDDGSKNPRFLDASYAIDTVLGPCLRGLGAKLGTFTLQFSPLRLSEVGGAEGVVERLGPFLTRLPTGVPISIEFRNAEFLRDDALRHYRDVLSASGAAHCFNVHPSMPPIAKQAALLPVETQPALVVRWMLGHGQEYDGAKDRYAPFDRIVDADLPNRRAVAELVRRAAALRRESYVIANNKAEGSAPWTLVELANELFNA